MQTNLRGRDFIGDLDFSKEEVETVLEVAWDLKRKRALGEPHALLRDKTLAMLFFFTSTRTRGSFEAGMAQLGGHAAFIDSETTQISHGDTAKEIGQIFGRYFDGIAIRQCDWQFGNKYENEVALHSRAPVLNMQCDVYHPFQSHDRDRKEGPRFASQENGGVVGLRRLVQQTDLGAAIPHPADDALRLRCGARPPARVQTDARDHGHGARERPQTQGRL